LVNGVEMKKKDSLSKVKYLIDLLDSPPNAEDIPSELQTAFQKLCDDFVAFDKADLAKSLRQLEFDRWNERRVELGIEPCPRELGPSATIGEHDLFVQQQQEAARLKRIDK